MQTNEAPCACKHPVARWPTSVKAIRNSCDRSNEIINCHPLLIIIALARRGRHSSLPSNKLNSFPAATDRYREEETRRALSSHAASSYLPRYSSRSRSSQHLKPIGALYCALSCCKYYIWATNRAKIGFLFTTSKELQLQVLQSCNSHKGSQHIMRNDDPFLIH